MERTACVDIRALPLQLLLHQHPEWTGQPAVVVDKDKPLGIIQWSNQRALSMRILPGMRYSAGLSITRDLHGGTISEVEITAARDRIIERLWQFSPRVEPFTEEAGIFWLDASGLHYLFPSLSEWAQDIQQNLRGIGFKSLVSVGYSRFGSYAVIKAASQNVILKSPAQEKSGMRKVSVERLGIDPVLRDTLSKLGVKTLGDFAKLPVDGIRKRFGESAEELHKKLHQSWEILSPKKITEPIKQSMCFDWPENKTDRLLASITNLLSTVLGQLKERYQSLEVLYIVFILDDQTKLKEEIAPAEPTLEANPILLLVRLRLEKLKLQSGVIEVLLGADGVNLNEGQLPLLQDSARDTNAGYRALATIRAQLGNHAIVQAKIMEGHLPEAQVHWEPFRKLVTPQPRNVSIRPLIRRIYTPPRELPGCDHRDPDGWLIAGVSEGPVEEVIGPHILSGGWWTKEITRAYYYVRTRRGRWLWIYHDDKRKRWYLHGEVQ